VHTTYRGYDTPGLLAERRRLLRNK
jgi:hypothetical protein